MPNAQGFLDATHEVYQKNLAAWKREERRLYGRDAVLVEDELERFTNESETSYTARKAQATYLNFPAIHAKILAGHLGRVAPMPDFGTMGDVRQRGDITGRPSIAELFFYNCDGVGSDGTQFRAWTTGVQERAIATGHRWVLVEMPKRVGDNGRPATLDQILAGQRPFVVEYSPIAVPYWEVTEGRLDWAVVRTQVRKAGALWEPNQLELGYYLLVRQGYAGLGDEFAGGGWWLYHGDKTPVDGMQGDWSRTRGQIPLCQLVAESSFGTAEVPAVSGSLTMELGQIGVSLMNRISERNWDARDAAKSIKYVLGAEKDAFNLMVEHHEANSILVPVIGSATPDGKWLIPSIYDGSSGAVTAEVFSTIISSTLAEAHEIMVRQLTSEPDSSGRSKEVGFGEATSPLLASLAARRETFENTLIYFAELRAGSANPSGSVVWPTEFELAPIVAKIDQTIERMLKLGARSATLEASLIESAAKDDGVWVDDEDRVVREELAASLSSARPEQSASVQQLTASGGTLEGAAKLVGIGDDAIALLVGGGVNGSPDQALPEAGAVTAGGGAGNAITGGGVMNSVSSEQVPGSTPPPNAPDETASELAALRSEVADLATQFRAFLGALQQIKADMTPPPAPTPPAPLVVFPPERPSVGKSVAVVTPEGKRWAVTVTPQDDTQAPPPPNA